MQVIKKAEERTNTHANSSDSWQSFSYENSSDTQHTGMGPLSFLNDNIVAPQQHLDFSIDEHMEIINIVVKGALEHTDNNGHHSLTTAGSVLKMTAGANIQHTLFNPSQTDPLHFLQVGIIPKIQDVMPLYQQKNFSDSDRHNLLCLVASNERDKDTLLLHADVQIYQSQLDEFKAVGFTVPLKKTAWIQVAQGSVQIGNLQLNMGDGLVLWDEEKTFQIMGKAKESNFVLLEFGR